MNLLDLLLSTGVEPKKVSDTHGGEYHSACPWCGGKDRFRIQPHRPQKNCVGYYCCRQCNRHGDTIQFCMDYFGLPYPEAVKQAQGTLQQTAGVIRRKPTSKAQPPSLTPPPPKWINKAEFLVDSAYLYGLQSQEHLTYLAQRGIPLEAVHKYRIGLLEHRPYFDRTSWGLEANNDDNKLLVPTGIVIPITDGSDVVRIKIRCDNWQEGSCTSKYVAVSGSMNGLSIIGNAIHRVMLVVESELDAYALHHLIGDFAVVVAIGGNMKTPDRVTEGLAKKASHLLICHDNDEAGQKMLAKWSKLYPQAKAFPTPIGKDIGEAIEKGLDVKKWVLEKVNRKQKE